MTATLLPLGIKSTVFATPKSGDSPMNTLVTSLQRGQTFDCGGEIEGQVFEISLIILQKDETMIEFRV